jgi:excisionase family DNA binding protein
MALHRGVVIVDLPKVYLPVHRDGAEIAFSVRIVVYGKVLEIGDYSKQFRYLRRMHCADPVGQVVSRCLKELVVQGGDFLSVDVMIWHNVFLSASEKYHCFSVGKRFIPIHRALYFREGMMDTSDLMTAAEAAEQLGIKVTSVRTAMQEGRLPFILLYRRRLVKRQDVLAYKARAHRGGEKPRGRPSKKQEDLDT